MTEFLKSLKITGRGESREIMQVLRSIDREKRPVLMEIEGSHIHFRSVLAVKKGVVVIAKPDGLGPHLKKDDVVRFPASEGDESRDLRLQVISPHFNLTSGNAVFLCHIPAEFSEGSKRKSVRFNTSRFNNLHAVFPATNWKYRIVDLSSNGFKFYVPQGDLDKLFPLGDRIQPAQLIISKYKAELDGVIPRLHKANTVGCEMVISSGNAAQKYIDHLVASLLKSEEDRLRGENLS